MRIVVAIALVLSGCAGLQLSKEEYVLKLTERCESIELTPQRTKLTCPNYVDKKVKVKKGRSHD